MNNNSYYIDSCVFLDYINAVPGKVEIIDALLDEVEKNNDQIITSTVAIVEVAHAKYEKDTAVLDPEIEKHLEEMWCDPTITLVDLNDAIAQSARALIRFAIQENWGKLTPKDAVHLASAKWIHDHIMPIQHFFTYDNKLFKYGPVIGMQIEQPFIAQPSLLQE